jgi:hypothetical protein
MQARARYYSPRPQAPERQLLPSSGPTEMSCTFDCATKTTQSPMHSGHQGNGRRSCCCTCYCTYCCICYFPCYRIHCCICYCHHYHIHCCMLLHLLSQLPLPPLHLHLLLYPMLCLLLNQLSYLLSLSHHPSLHLPWLITSSNFLLQFQECQL